MTPAVTLGIAQIQKSNNTSAYAISGINQNAQAVLTEIAAKISKEKNADYVIVLAKK